MFTLFLSLLILDGLLLMVIVLLQSGKGGGLAAMGGGAGTEAFIGGRQAATLLTKATWVTGGLFLGIALMLAVLSSREQRPESILREEFQQTAPAAPQPILPGVQPAEPQEGGQTGEQPSPPPTQPAPSQP
ncbi:MAG: preprotein translocase subunit SecG [Gemmatimonadetes bacterium]|nr:preprotein translocase subunit SecG [Gemmatimonadota bacterium]